jgi:hypothetical protein
MLVFWLRGSEVKLPRFLQIGERFFFAFALTGDINFQTLRDHHFPSRKTFAANGLFIASFFHRS